MRASEMASNSGSFLLFTVRAILLYNGTLTEIVNVPSQIAKAKTANTTQYGLVCVEYWQYLFLGILSIMLSIFALSFIIRRGSVCFLSAQVLCLCTVRTKRIQRFIVVRSDVVCLLIRWNDTIYTKTINFNCDVFGYLENVILPPPPTIQDIQTNPKDKPWVMACARNFMPYHHKSFMIQFRLDSTVSSSPFHSLSPSV